ncbi:MAG: hypothetical protein ACK4EX_08365 [Thermaurantimonas sp.]|uniref:hypothetical protein n=1 Tax=Thermaurantimonas sp. TaxID=2681568 RepID=UPI00391BD108
MPLLYGTTRVYVDGGLLVVERNYLGKRIRAFFNNTASPRPMPDGKLLLTNSADSTLSPYTSLRLDKSAGYRCAIPSNYS